MHDCMEMVNRNNCCIDFLGYEALREQFVHEELTLLFAFHTICCFLKGY